MFAAMHAVCQRHRDGEAGGIAYLANNNAAILLPERIGKNVAIYATGGDT